MRRSFGGDEKAFETIYDRYATPLFRYFCRMLHNDREKAEDFIQDIFAKLVQKPEAYNPSRPFKTWLYSVANNMCKNEYRRLAVRKGTDNSLENGMDVVGSSGHEIAQHHDLKVFGAALQNALDALDEKQRDAFLMRYDQDMSIKEIAAVFTCSEGTIKSRLFYTLRKLSGELHVFNPHSMTP